MCPRPSALRLFTTGAYFEPCVCRNALRNPVPTFSDPGQREKSIVSVEGYICAVVYGAVPSWVNSFDNMNAVINVLKVFLKLYEKVGYINKIIHKIFIQFYYIKNSQGNKRCKYMTKIITIH